MLISKVYSRKRQLFIGLSGNENVNHGVNTNNDLDQAHCSKEGNSVMHSTPISHFGSFEKMSPQYCGFTSKISVD